MLVRRGAALAIVAALLVACLSGGDDEPEATEADPAPTTTTPVEGTLPPAVEDAEVIEGEDLADLDELLRFVEDARGREFVTEPVVRLAPDGTYEEILEPLLGLDLDALIAEGAYLEALGLIPEGTAVAYAQEQQARVLGSLGLYDDETKLLLVRGDDLASPATRTVVVHELTHALDDQHFGLGRPGYDIDRSSERSSTFQSVTEGDATRVEEAYVATLDDDEQDEVESVNGPTGGAAGDLESFEDFGALSPYIQGRDFLDHVATTGGEPRVDAVFADPPDTTEQVLHPDAFDRGEDRIRVTPPPADGPILDQGVSGEAFFLTLFTFGSPSLDPADAEPAATGWGGDWSVSWADEASGQTCTRTDVTGDTPADTAELLAALETWALDRPSATVAAVGAVVRMEVCYEVPVLASGNPAR